MAYEDVTKEYIDLISYNRYASRTSNSTELDAIKTLQAEYLTNDWDWIPEKKYNRGLALLVCHYYAMDLEAGPDDGSGMEDTIAGLLTTDKVGDITKVRGLPYLGNVDGAKMYLLQTKYGTEFLYLMKTFKSSVFTT